jgi:hypothetical protein
MGERRAEMEGHSRMAWVERNRDFMKSLAKPHISKTEQARRPGPALGNGTNMPKVEKGGARRKNKISLGGPKWSHEKTPDVEIDQ